jgi:hypothetical protein
MQATGGGMGAVEDKNMRDMAAKVRPLSRSLLKMEINTIIALSRRFHCSMRLFCQLPYNLHRVRPPHEELESTAVGFPSRRAVPPLDDTHVGHCNQLRHDNRRFTPTP